MAQAKMKRKARARAKTVRKTVATAKPRIRRAAKKAMPRRRGTKPSLARELGALAEKLTSLGKTVIEQGAERAGEIARAGVSAIEHGGGKIGHEIAAIKRAALARVKH